MRSYVNTAKLDHFSAVASVLPLSRYTVVRSVPGVAKIREVDRVFAEGIGNVLRQLRAIAGMTQAEAAEHLGVEVGSLGRWERADFAPKGPDLARLYLGYEEFGAQIEWFLFPPEVVVTDPVRDRLDELARSGAIAAANAEGRARARRRRGGAKRDGERGRRSA